MASKGQNMYNFAKPYIGYMIGILVLNIISSGLNLVLPRLIGQTIDKYNTINNFSLFISSSVPLFVFIISGILIVSVLLTILTNYTSELVARNMRNKIVDKISKQNFSYVSGVTPSKLLTIVTSDVDIIKMMLSQSFVYMISAIVMLLGSVFFLFAINARLAAIVIIVIPVMAVTFGLIFGKLGKFFSQSQQNLEKMNRVINESIVGAGLIRTLNSKTLEVRKFSTYNEKARDISLSVIKIFSIFIPLITLISNAVTLSIIWFGGNQVINGTMSLGEFTSFVSYVSLLLTPIFILGFIMSSFSRAFVSLERINDILAVEEVDTYRSVLDKNTDIKGDIVFENINMNIKEKNILKDISFNIKSGSRTAIIGPTGAGKTQLFLILAGLITPDSGRVTVDGHEIFDYDPDTFYKSVGLVFQDSIIFNTTLEENIQFRSEGNSENIDKAIHTANLSDLVSSLPAGLNTVLSERGTNISGGQKQRLTLARALALNPKILLLDDFTARVDIYTEQKILDSLKENYPDITLISITQKIDPIKDYDQIILIMDGEIIMSGTHDYLIHNSIEYQQIYQSQQSS